MTTTHWTGPDRRRGRPDVPVFGALLLEAAWQPSEEEAIRYESWLRAYGHQVDRRAQ